MNIRIMNRSMLTACPLFVLSILLHVIEQTGAYVAPGGLLSIPCLCAAPHITHQVHVTLTYNLTGVGK